MLDIIIPHYDEPWSEGKKLFEMLAMQREVDWSQIRVTLVNDGEEHSLPEKLFADYPFPFRQMSIPHGGVSAARNAGFEATDEPWVMWCDFDDSFTYIYALHDIMGVMGKADPYDIVWVDLIIENTVKGNHILAAHPELNSIFVHGKLFKRKFLADNHMRFNTDLRFNEDSEFVTRAIVMSSEERIIRLKTPYPPYAQFQHDGSTCNREGTTVPAIIGHWHRNRLICEVYAERLPYNRVCAMVGRTVLDAYYALNHDNLEDGLKGMQEEFVSWYKQHEKEYHDIDPEDIPPLIKIAYSERDFKDRFRENVTIRQWLSGLGLNP